MTKFEIAKILKKHGAIVVGGKVSKKDLIRIVAASKERKPSKSDLLSFFKTQSVDVVGGAVHEFQANNEAKEYYRDTDLQGMDRNALLKLIRSGAVEYKDVDKALEKIKKYSVLDWLGDQLAKDDLKGGSDEAKRKKSRLVKASEKQEVSHFRLIDYGVADASHFKGDRLGDFDEAFVGTGNSQREALEQAAEEASLSWNLPDDLLDEISSASDQNEVAYELQSQRPAEVWTVSHSSRSMGSDLETKEFDSEEEAQAYAKRRLEYLENHDFIVEDLGGNKWEITDPDDAGMVSDENGILSIENNSEDLEKFDESNLEVYYYAAIQLR